MTTQTKTITPVEYVEAAEREYAVGNDRESARLLADATDALFDMLAEASGFDPSDHLAMAIAMGKEEGRRFYYSDRFGAGRNLRLHAEPALWKNTEWSNGCTRRNSRSSARPWRNWTAEAAPQVHKAPVPHTLNILHVTPSMSPQWGGPVAVVSQLIPALSDEGIHCEIATASGHRVGHDPASLRDVPTHVFHANLPARIWTAYSKDLTRFLDENITQFDLVHAHEIWHHPAYAAFQAARKNAVPYILTPHGELSEWSMRHKRWKKRIYTKAVLDRVLRNADALHAITPAEKDRIAQLGYQTPVTVASNGIDPAPFHNLPDPSDFLAGFPTLNGKRVILFLGRLNPTKGLDILARAFSSIARRFPDAILLMAGPDEEGGQRAMESILRSEGVLDRAIFTGMLTGADKFAALSRADLFVLPSYSEGFSIAILEAMAARLPVVISEGCNFPEVAEHRAGFVVQASDAPVAEAMSALLSDPDLSAQMGERGRRLVTRRYTWKAAAAIIARLYAELTAKTPQ